MKRVLITGGASGFGQALAKVYAARGDRVLVTDVASTQAEVDLPRITGKGEVWYERLDVRDDVDWERVRDAVVERWGGVDMLINNAGVAAGGRFDKLPMKEWYWIIDINLLGVVRGCATFVPLFKEQRSGHVVNTASLAGLTHAPGMASYNTAKAAVVGLSETLLHELSPHGITVSVICPSFFRTNLDKSLPGNDPTLEADAVRLITEARRSADLVAARAVKQLDKGRYLVLVDVDARVFGAYKRLLPFAYHATLKRVGSRLAKRAAIREDDDSGE